VQKCAISANSASGRDNAVAGNLRVPALPHDGTDRTGGAGGAGKPRDVSVGRDPPSRNPAND